MGEKARVCPRAIAASLLFLFSLPETVRGLYPRHGKFATYQHLPDRTCSYIQGGNLPPNTSLSFFQPSVRPTAFIFTRPPSRQAGYAWPVMLGLLSILVLKVFFLSE